MNYPFFHFYVHRQSEREIVFQAKPLVELSRCFSFLVRVDGEAPRPPLHARFLVICAEHDTSQNQLKGFLAVSSPFHFWKVTHFLEMMLLGRLDGR